MTEDTTNNKEVLEAEQRYKVNDMVFIVKPDFKKEGNQTLATALLNLMQGEVETD